MCVAAWYQECQRRKNGKTLKNCQHDVEQFVCAELMKTGKWDQWVEVVDEFREGDYAPVGNFPNREESSPNTGDRFMVVFPFCMKDGHLAIKQMRWVSELGPYEHDALLSYDFLTMPSVVETVYREASKCFKTVLKHGYGAPRPEHWAPTIAFKEAAKKMQELGKPWLWMESDAVPLKKGWLDKLQDLYWNCGKAFAGPIVRDMGHCNGTAIYPANTPNRIPKALSILRTAWDVTMKPEMIHDCCNLHPWFFHSWGLHQGKLHPYLGSPPSFRDGRLLDQIPNEAVVFHRDKGLLLIDRIKERMAVKV